MEKLLGVLWAYRTTKHIPTGKTPFLLAYGTKAIIYVDICMPTVRTLEIDQSHNATQLCLKLDQLEEQRREAQIRIISYQQQIKASHHR